MQSYTKKGRRPSTKAHGGIKQYADIKPTIWIGKQGISESLFDEIRGQMKTRHIIKIKWLQSVEVDPKEIARSCNAVLVQTRGRTMVIAERGHQRG
ncbi:MAG: YhbY family RNA-binding protein [Methanomicrobiales archaeon]|jgi:RNA-binding protein|nr:YhbY family RNA-binding protein [Methanomicrobiales archaeon]